MTKITCTYLGEGQTELLHGPTGETIRTDLPPDNGGQGRLFSPTDLLAGALASCIITIIAKMAERDGQDLKGMRIETDKIMAASPRRVAEFVLDITFPPHFTQAQKDRYAAAVNACPVHRSLHPDIKTTVHIH